VIQLPKTHFVSSKLLTVNSVGYRQLLQIGIKTFDGWIWIREFKVWLVILGYFGYPLHPYVWVWLLIVFNTDGVRSMQANQWSTIHGSTCVHVCCLHLKMEFRSCASGVASSRAFPFISLIIHYHWWTASIKPKLLFFRAGYATWGLSLSSV